MIRLLLILFSLSSPGFALVPALTPRAEPQSEATTDLQRRNKILLVHAICGFLALQVIAPLGQYSLNSFHYTPTDTPYSGI